MSNMRLQQKELTPNLKVSAGFESKNKFELHKCKGSKM